MKRILCLSLLLLALVCAACAPETPPEAAPAVSETGAEPDAVAAAALSEEQVRALYAGLGRELLWYQQAGSTVAAVSSEAGKWWLALELVDSYGGRSLVDYLYALPLELTFDSPETLTVVGVYEQDGPDDLFPRRVTYMRQGEDAPSAELRQYAAFFDDYAAPLAESYDLGLDTQRQVRLDGVWLTAAGIELAYGPLPTADEQELAGFYADYAKCPRHEISYDAASHALLLRVRQVSLGQLEQYQANDARAAVQSVTLEQDGPDVLVTLQLNSKVTHYTCALQRLPFGSRHVDTSLQLRFSRP